MRIGHPIVAGGIVFVASFCTLVIELVAARILAPYIGVSLYTWTSIIGVCLAGIAAGNYAGGRLADRRASASTLGVLLVLAGAASLAILPLVGWVIVQPAVRDLPLTVRIVAQSGLLFFAPTFLLGTITPVVVTLALSDLARTGSTVGRIYAVSTVGAIAGTFATGFILVDAFGTRAIVSGVAVVLVALGAAVGGLWRTRPRALVLAAVVAGSSVILARPDAYRAPCLEESAYYCIAILDEEVEGRPVRSLALDHLIHSYVDPADPLFIGYGYERVYAEVTAFHARERPAFATLSIGGGGYTFPRYLLAAHPDARADVIEIDPEVTRVAHERLALPHDERLRTVNADARLWFIEERPAGRYDVVYGDAYNDLSVPFHLTTLEFAELVRTSLAPDGIFLANVIDNFSTGEFLRAYVRTLTRVFGDVRLLASGPRWEEGSAATYVVLASLRPFDEAAFVAHAGTGRSTAVLAPEALREFLSRGRDLVLTDDHAPVDNLTAPIFLERETW